MANSTWTKYIARIFSGIVNLVKAASTFRALIFQEHNIHYTDSSPVSDLMCPVDAHVDFVIRFDGRARVNETNGTKSRIPGETTCWT